MWKMTRLIFPREPAGIRTRSGLRILTGFRTNRSSVIVARGGKDVSGSDVVDSETLRSGGYECSSLIWRKEHSTPSDAGQMRFRVDVEGQY